MRPRNRNRFAKSDLNQSDFARTLMGCGLSVEDTHTLGNGFPDVVVGGYNIRTGRPESLPVEIKSAGNLEHITPAEARWEEDWRGSRMRTEDPDDVLRYFGLVD